MMTKCLVMALLLQTSLGAAGNNECTGSECTEDADDMSMLQTKSEKIGDGADLQKVLDETRQELKEAHARIGLLEAELKAEKEEQEAEEGEKDEAEWGYSGGGHRRRSRRRRR